jgi:hypothetical protein
LVTDGSLKDGHISIAAALILHKNPDLREIFIDAWTSDKPSDTTPTLPLQTECPPTELFAKT